MGNIQHHRKIEPFSKNAPSEEQQEILNTTLRALRSGRAAKRRSLKERKKKFKEEQKIRRIVQDEIMKQTDNRESYSFYY